MFLVWKNKIEVNRKKSGLTFALNYHVLQEGMVWILSTLERVRNKIANIKIITLALQWASFVTAVKKYNPSNSQVFYPKMKAFLKKPCLKGCYKTKKR